jgi:gamma-glutamyltranspeptidase/glutathione hydrolase
MQKGDTRIAFGIMGGWNQSQAHAQFVSNVVDFGMNIQGALDAARFSKTTFDGCDLSMETRVSPAVIKELESMGHVIKTVGQYYVPLGVGQAVMSVRAGSTSAGRIPAGTEQQFPKTLISNSRDGGRHKKLFQNIVVFHRLFRLPD